MIRWLTRKLAFVSLLLLVAAPLALGEEERAGDGAARPLDPAPRDVGVPKRIELGAELPELRTERSRTYSTASGNRLTKVFAVPVNYRGVDRRWHPIDTRLERTGDTLRPKATGYELTLPAVLGDPVRVADGASWLEFELRSPAAARAEADGASVSYPDVADGVDLEYLAMSAGLKETLVLADSRAPSTHRFDLRVAPGHRAKVTDAGGIDVEDGEGRVALAIAPPSMADAAGATSRAVSYRLSRRDGAYLLTLTADRDWLEDPERRYPVEVDPTVYPAPQRDCALKSGTPATSHCAEQQLEVGWNGTHDHRTMLRFEVANIVPKTARLEEAYLALFHKARTTTTNKPLGLYRLTRDWTTSASWNTYNGTNAWTSAGGDFDTSKNWSLKWLGFDAPGARSYWGVSELVQAWLDGTPNYGFLIKDRDDRTVNNQLTFASAEDPDPAKRPYLGISWDERTGVPRQYTTIGERLSDRMSASVNVANGNLVVANNDMRIAGTGLGLEQTRYYNNMGVQPDVKSGYGWQLSGGMGTRLETVAGGQTFVDASGGRHLYNRQADGSFKAPTGVDAALATDGTGHKLTFEKSKEIFRFNASGDLTKHEDRNGNAITYTYASARKLSSITDTQGRQTTVTYDASGRVQRLTDPASRTYNYTYDAAGNLVTYTDPAGKVIRYTYANDPDLIEIEDARGTVTKIDYDTSKRVISFRRGYNRTTGTHVARTTYSYQAPTAPCVATDVGKTVVTNPRGNSTTYCFDGELRVTKVVDAAGQQRSTTYTPNSDVLSFQNGTGGPTTRFTWDTQKNNLQAVDRPAGERGSFTYGDSANPHFATQYTSPQSSSTAFAYTPSGNLSSATNGQSPTQIQARLEYNGDTTGSCTNDAATKRGTLRCAVDGNGNRTTYGYDAQGNLTRVTPPAPVAQSTYTYDTVSRMRTMRDGKGQTSTYSYDLLDRLTRIDFADGGYVTYAYDANGNRTQRVDSVHGTTTWTIDGLNRRTKDTLPGAWVTQYGYDAASNMTSLSNSGGTVTYGYDSLDRLTSLTEPGSVQATFGYDARNNRTRTTYASGLVDTRTYDSSDKPLTIEARKGLDPPLVSFTYTYRDASARNTELRQTARDKFGDTVTYAYDALDRLRDATTRNSAGTVTDARSYAYDAASNRTRDTVNGQTTTWAYGAANQACWKVAGTSANACASPPAGATTYTHDANGNYTGSNAGHALVYNARNQTTSLTSTGPSAETTAQTYAGEGQSELTGSGVYTYKNDLLGVSMLDGDVWGRADLTREPSGKLHAHRQYGEHTFQLTDAIGSVVALTNETGTNSGYFKYEPWGMTPYASGQNRANYFWFTGGLYVNGTHHFGQRFYSHGSARWTQPDPIDHPGDLREGNRYVYAASDPVNLTDPSGTDVEKEFFKLVDDLAHDLHSPKAFGAGAKAVGRVIPGLGTAIAYDEVRRRRKNAKPKCFGYLCF